MHLADRHEGEVLAAASFNLPSAEYSVAVRIDQDGDKQFRMLSMLSFRTVLAFDLGRVELL